MPIQPYLPKASPPTVSITLETLAQSALTAALSFSVRLMLDRLSLSLMMLPGEELCLNSVAPLGHTQGIWYQATSCDADRTHSPDLIETCLALGQRRGWYLLVTSWVWICKKTLCIFSCRIPKVQRNHIFCFASLWEVRGEAHGPLMTDEWRTSQAEWYHVQKVYSSKNNEWTRV